MTDTTHKKELRQYYSAQRKNIKNTEKDNAITLRLLSEEIIKNADVVLLYASFGSEINTWDIAQTLLDRNVTLAYPLCGEDSEMTFHVVSSFAQLTVNQYGKFGIREPDISFPQPVITEKSVCILPGLAFTEVGGRLGYGGGFYDRFLAKNENVNKIALSYEKLIVPELPLLPHDIRTDMIITEERMVFCNAK